MIGLRARSLSFSLSLRKARDRAPTSAQVTIGGAPAGRVDLLSATGADGAAAAATVLLAVEPPPLAAADADAAAGAVSSQLAVRREPEGLR